MDFKSSNGGHRSADGLTAQSTLWTELESVYQPRFIQGNCMDVLRGFESESVDCCMTSPPYWGQRDYLGKSDGQESTVQQYLSNLLAIFSEIRRVLKPTGSFWLNIGDCYVAKSLTGIAWRLALKMVDEQQWVPGVTHREGVFFVG